MTSQLFFEWALGALVIGAWAFALYLALRKGAEERQRDRANQEIQREALHAQRVRVGMEARG